ncbi:hypothetical protein ELQ35_05825 [Peribacillus cavernae]|uniref:Uncharacterized protein n=1 Tax=Peribacillus cavernae TaxID=1674310 RepID=A0A3S0WA35_9BACI|nr:hypothetical protein [Peribacillus cavernae]MDQ0220635.1 glutaredoxin [Peribacillus cavernae]RUQ31095.1 hypothetical protein ELQ35_05825 [Peribacillus cavernae]
MENETNVCFYCKRLVTFTTDTCPNCHKPKKFIFEKEIKKWEVQKKKQQADWNKNELARLRNLNLSKIQWEYIKVVSPTEHEMNKLGAYGWELIVTHTLQQDEDKSKQEYIFKRIYNK